VKKGSLRAKPTCFCGATGAGSGTELSAVDNSFVPSEISAPAGEEVTVTFTNEGNNPHTFSPRKPPSIPARWRPGHRPRWPSPCPTRRPPSGATSTGRRWAARWSPRV